MTPSPRNHVSSTSNTTTNHLQKANFDNEDAPYDGANNTDNPLAFLNEMSDQLSSMKSNATSSNVFSRDVANNLTTDLSNYGSNRNDEKVSKKFHILPFQS